MTKMISKNGVINLRRRPPDWKDRKRKPPERLVNWVSHATLKQQKKPNESDEK